MESRERENEKAAVAFGVHMTSPIKLSAKASVFAPAVNNINNNNNNGNINVNINGDGHKDKDSEIIIVVRDHKGMTLSCKVKKTTVMSKVFKAFADKNKFNTSSLRFIFNDKDILPTHTPQMLDINNNDQIDVYMTEDSKVEDCIIEKSSNIFEATYAVNNYMSSQNDTTIPMVSDNKNTSSTKNSNDRIDVIDEEGEIKLSEIYKENRDITYKMCDDDNNLIDLKYSGMSLRTSEERVLTMKKKAALEINLSQTVSNKEKAKQLNINSTPKATKIKKKFASPENTISEDTIVKRNKKNEKIEFMRRIDEEIIEDSLNSSPITREIVRSNLHPNWTKDTRLEDIEWSEMGALASLGFTIQFLPSDMIPHILTTYIKVLRDSGAEPDNMRLMKRVFLFTTILTLKIGVGSLRGNMRKTLDDINAGKWDGQTVGLFEGRIQEIKNKTKKKPSGIKIIGKDPEEVALDIVRKRAIKYIRVGEEGKGFKALMNVKPQVKPTIQTANELRSHQYQRRSIDDMDRNNIEMIPSTFILTPDECKKIVNGMHSSVAAGYDSLSIDHMKQLIRYKPGSQGEVTQSDIFVEELTLFINRALINPRVPREVSGYMSGGEQVAIGKDDGSIRPICMIMMFTKIATKAKIRDNKSSFDIAFGTEQVACGMSNGMDKMGHAIRIAMGMHPTFDFIKSDADGAFQRLDIDKSLEVISQDVPGILEFLEPLLNTKKNHVYFGCEKGVETIESVQGPGQGLPYASHTFGLSKSRITRKAKDFLVSGGISIDMADDNGSVGQTEELMDMAEFMAKEGKPYGIITKKSKYVVLLGVKDTIEEAIRIQTLWCQRFDISPSVVHIHPLNLQIPDREEEYGCDMLGTPLGSDAYIKKKLQEKMLEMDVEFKRIPKLNNSQGEYSFVKNIMNGKATFIARAVAPVHTESLFEQFDEGKRECLAEILDAKKISDKSWSLAKLEYGGGLGGMLDSDAFVASVMQSIKYVIEVIPKVEGIISDVMNIFDTTDIDLLEKILNDEKIPAHLVSFFVEAKGIQNRDGEISIKSLMKQPEQELKKLQAKLGKNKKISRSEEYKHRLFLDNDTVGLAIFDSIYNEESMSYVLAKQTAPDMRLNNEQFKLVMKMRLGIEAVQPGLQCDCHNRPILDSQGIHAQSCTGDGLERIGAHDEVNQVWVSMLKYAGIPCSTKFADPFRGKVINGILSTDKKRGDIMIWKGGGAKPLMTDMRLTNPVTAAIMRGTIQNAGGAAKASQLEKERKFKAECEQVGIDFGAVVIESYGKFGEFAKELFKSTISAAADNKNIDISYLKNFWLKRISMAVQRGVANKVLARVSKLIGGKEAEKDSASNFTNIMLQSNIG